LSSVGASSWYGANIGYYGTDGVHLTQTVNLGTQITNSYTYGANLTQTNVAYIVYDALVAGTVPNDPVNGLYFVLTSKDVKGIIKSSLYLLTTDSCWILHSILRLSLCIFCRNQQLQILFGW
jgi:hypothetical protein